MSYRLKPHFPAAVRLRRGLVLPPGLGSITTDLAGAITRMEGSCTSAGSCRNNNPGNLRAGPGAIGTDSRGIAIFPDYQTGEAALERQVDLNIGRGLSLQEFFGGKPGVYAGYAPAADANNPAGYAATVAGWIGIDPSVPLNQLSSDSGSLSDSPGTFDMSASSAADGTSGLSGAAWLGLGAGALALVVYALG